MQSERVRANFQATGNRQIVARLAALCGSAIEFT